MRKVFSVSLLTVLLSLPSTAQVRHSAVDCQKEQGEILRHYRNLVQINTVYGNETKATEYVKKSWMQKAFPQRPSHSIPIAQISSLALKAMAVNGRC
jgi:hypothetical protein